jgi:mannose-6-phosphate isomerase-like protein (cupin superfamily)
MAFRRVLATGRHTQLVAMALGPGEDIGQETHRAVEQVFFVLAGHGVATVSGRRKLLRPGDALVVPPGHRHNVANTGKRAWLKLLTVYSPPNHLPGRVHRTKQDAVSDDADEAFGRRVGG